MDLQLTPDQIARIVADANEALRAKRSEGMRRYWAAKSAEQRSGLMRRIGSARWAKEKSKKDAE